MNRQQKNFILLALAAVNFTHIVDSMLIMPLGDIFISEFNLNPDEYSWLVSSYAFAAFFSSLLGIFLLDRLDRKHALLFLYAGFSLATFATSWCTTFESLLGIRLVTGLFGGMIGAVVLSVVSDVYPFSERGKAMGIIFAAFSVASALGVPAGIFLADWGSWKLPFVIIGLLGFIIWMCIWWIFPSMSNHKISNEGRHFLQGLTFIMRDKNQLIALVSAFTLVLGHFMIIPFISPYMIRNVGLNQTEISYQFLLGGIATVISSPYIGKLTDRIGVMKVFSWTMALSFIPTLLITNLPPSALWIALTCTTLFFIFGTGRMISPNALITAAAPPQNRGSFMSLKSATQQLAIGLSAFISGQLVVLNEANLYTGYYKIGILAIVFGLITIWLMHHVRVAAGNL